MVTPSIQGSKHVAATVTMHALERPIKSLSQIHKYTVMLGTEQLPSPRPVDKRTLSVDVSAMNTLLTGTPSSCAATWAILMCRPCPISTPPCVTSTCNKHARRALSVILTATPALCQPWVQHQLSNNRASTAPACFLTIVQLVIRTLLQSRVSGELLPCHLCRHVPALHPGCR